MVITTLSRIPYRNSQKSCRFPETLTEMFNPVRTERRECGIHRRKCRRGKITDTHAKQLGGRRWFSAPTQGSGLQKIFGIVSFVCAVACTFVGASLHLCTCGCLSACACACGCVCVCACVLFESCPFRKSTQRPSSRLPE